MKISGELSGIANLSAKLQAISDAVKANSKDALVDAVLGVHSTAVQSIQEHQSVGEIVTRYNPKRQVDVSEAGATPNSDLGKLAQSIEFNIDDDTLTGQVGTNLIYGPYLEFGTLHMAPRPWLYPAVENNKDKIRNLFEVTFKDATSKGSK